MRSFVSFLMFLGLATMAGAEELSWSDLARRPELWPAQCTVNHVMQFQGGKSVPAGQKVAVHSVKPNEVDLATLDGRLNFAADPDETDVLVVARDAYAKLTPKQRELTYPMLAQKKELWPDVVTLTQEINLGSSGILHRGDQVTLKDVLPRELHVISEKLKARFSLEPEASDLMAQARQFVESKDGVSPRFIAEQAAAEKLRKQGPIVTELDGRLISSATGKPSPLDTNALPRYIVFLRGSTTCPITRRFAPGFVKFCNEIKSTHPEVEVVYLTVDSVDDTEKFAKELGFSWRAVTYENTTMPSVTRYIDGKLPQLLVMDRSGRVLANGIQASAPTALKQLDALLKQPTAQN